MSTTTQFTGSVDPDWPITAIPQRWVEALFSTMSATYGARFADLWRGSDIAQVKRVWGIELAKLTSAQMKSGRENLMQLVKAPTCPEFVAHCRQAHREVAASTPFQLEHTPKTTAEEAARNLGAVRSAMSVLRSPEPTAEWAYTLLLRGTGVNGKPLTFEAVRCASDAITSNAGRKVVESCENPDLREQYRELRDGIIHTRRESATPLWETA
jgi:hypothetical protein